MLHHAPVRAAPPVATTRLTPRQADWLALNTPEDPVLIMDLDLVARAYGDLAAGLGDAAIYYAVKANPGRPVLETLAALGASFDCASRGEVEACLALGIRPDRIAFGNTIKKPGDIAHAHGAGVRQFAADAEDELVKIATHAPGARVILRMLVTDQSADWPLSRKFGASAAEVLRLMAVARGLGLDAAGISFHAGSQMRDPAHWAATLDQAAELWRAGLAAGHDLRVLNIGGGFPARYGEPVPDRTGYASAVMAAVRRRFPGVAVMAEPGRALVAEAGAIAARVLLVARKDPSDLVRWVFLDIGKFSGLAETMDEAIRYPLETPYGDAVPMGPCVLAGPSCDSADVLYERRPVQLPLALASGDPILIACAGAYTTSYASVGFNGFAPLQAVYL